MKKSVLLQCRQRARFAAARLVRTLTPEVGEEGTVTRTNQAKGNRNEHKHINQ